MYIVTVLFKIHPSQHQNFMEAMHANAQTSLATESGCKQFDVCEGEPGDGVVFLYEVYDSKDDFTAHLVAPHFVQFNAKTTPWVAHKQVQTFYRHTAPGIDSQA